MTQDSRLAEEVGYKIGKGDKTFGVVKVMLRDKCLSIGVKIRAHVGVNFLAMLYCVET